MPKLLTALFAGLFVFTGIYTFGNALLFDRLFICILIFTAIVCRKNINVLGVIVILVIQRLLEETAWTISELEFETLIKSSFYFLAIAIYWKVKHDAISRLVLLTLVLTLSAEFYWIFTEQKAPQVYWHVILVASYAYARHLIFMRVAYMDAWLKNDSIESINLDWTVYKINAGYCLLNFISIIEYLLRGVFGLKDILYAYYSYPYLAHALYTYLIWALFSESYKLLLPKLLKA